MQWTEQEELMLGRYAGIKSVNDISTALNRSRGSITQKASNMGISLACNNDTSKRGSKFKISEDTINEVKRLLAKGISYKKVSLLTGVSKPYVAQIKHGKGVRFKSDKNTTRGRATDFSKAFSIMSGGSRESRV